MAGLFTRVDIIYPNFNPVHVYITIVNQRGGRGQRHCHEVSSSVLGMRNVDPRAGLPSHIRDIYQILFGHDRVVSSLQPTEFHVHTDLAK